MNSVDRTRRTARMAALGSAAALTVAMGTGCGTRTADHPPPEQASLVTVPEDDLAPSGDTPCRAAPDVVLRRSERDASSCEALQEAVQLPRSGYPGATGQPLE
jgi:hypothetical protein